ncbi:MAG: hypothetical protein WCL18_10760 [bacterium]
MTKKKKFSELLPTKRKLYRNADGSSALDNLRLAKISGAKYFVTINPDVLLDRDVLEKAFSVKIVTPDEVLALKRKPL